MATKFGTATLQSGSVLGSFDSATGLTYGCPAGYSHLAVVPQTIAFDGSDEVTADLLAFLNGLQDNTYVSFQKDGDYNCDYTLVFQGRQNLCFDLNGATIRSKKKFPDSAHYTGLVITAKGDKEIWGQTPLPQGATPIILGANEQLLYSLPGTPSLKGWDYAQVSDDADGQDNIPTQSTLFAIRKETLYHAAVIGSNVQPPDGPLVPGTGIAAFFLGPNNSGLARFSFIPDDNGVPCRNIKIRNGRLLGTNDGSVKSDGTVIPPGSYDPQVVGQHGVDCKGVEGMEIGPNLEIGYVWGDGINIAVDNPAGPGTHLDPRPPGIPGGHPCRNVYVHDTEVHHNGRMGTALTSIIGALFERNNYHDTPRTGIDMEPPTLNPVMRVTIRSSVFKNIGFGFVSFASYPTGNNVYFDTVTIDGNAVDNVAFRLNNSVVGAGAVRWKYITVINNISTSTARVPYGYSDGLPVDPNGYAIGFYLTDHALVTGNHQVMQVREPVMFMAFGHGSRDIVSHDNDIHVGPTWQPHTAYQQAGPGVGADCVYDGFGNSYYCYNSHTSSAAGPAGNQPSFGASASSFWRSLQLSLDTYPFGLADGLSSGSTLVASGSSHSPQDASALLISGSTLDGGVGHAVRHGLALLNSGSTLEASGSVPVTAQATLVSGSVLRARGGTSHRFGDNEFREGGVALRGRGWDAGPWDRDGWDGLS